MFKKGELVWFRWSGTGECLGIYLGPIEPIIDDEDRNLQTHYVYSQFDRKKFDFSLEI